MTSETAPAKDVVANLQAVYGGPSKTAFGSAVFRQQAQPSEPLEPMAFERYRYFVGDLWERYGEDAW